MKTKTLADTPRTIHRLPTLLFQSEVDLDAIPVMVYNDTVIESHIGGGKVKIGMSDAGPYINGKKILLHLTDKQRTGGTMMGDDLCLELQSEVVLNGNVLAFLLAHVEFIPDEWKVDELNRPRLICFWGTTYRSLSGDLFIYCLSWIEGAWKKNPAWICHGWNAHRPAAVLSKSH